MPGSQLAALIAGRSFEDEYRCHTQLSTSGQALRGAKHDQRNRRQNADSRITRQESDGRCRPGHEQNDR